MMGGGFDSLYLDQVPPQVVQLTFVVGLVVPQEASGGQHHLQFAFTDQAGNTVAASEQLTPGGVPAPVGASPLPADAPSASSARAANRVTSAAPTRST